MDIYYELSLLSEDINPYIDLPYHTFDMSGKSFFDELNSLDLITNVSSLHEESSYSHQDEKLLCLHQDKITTLACQYELSSRIVQDELKSEDIMLPDNTCIYQVILHMYILTYISSSSGNTSNEHLSNLIDEWLYHCFYVS
jgi:hypothetical protein